MQSQTVCYQHVIVIPEKLVLASAIRNPESFCVVAHGVRPLSAGPGSSVTSFHRHDNQWRCCSNEFGLNKCTTHSLAANNERALFFSDSIDEAVVDHLANWNFALEPAGLDLLLDGGQDPRVENSPVERE